jgi:prepilin-type N-terminal cleavage/methylation domain-containing protein
VTRRQHGVTLLEMLVALAVFGVVAAILFQSFTRTLEARDHAGRRAEVFASARVVFDWLEHDLKGSLSVRTYPAGLTVFSSSGHAADDTLTADEPLLDLTVRTARRTGVVRRDDGEELALNQADQARVRYRIESGEEDGGLDLVRYEWRPPLEEAPGSEMRTVISGGVRYLDLRFETRGAVTERWDQRSGVASAAGPRIVEIRLALDGPDGRVDEFATSVLIPMGGRLG